MVVVWISVARVDRDVELVRALHEVEAVDGEDDFGVAVETLRVHLLDERVRAIATDTVRVEQADAEHEIGRRRMGGHFQANGHRIAGMKHKGRLVPLVEQGDVGDLDLA